MINILLLLKYGGMSCIFGIRYIPRRSEISKSFGGKKSPWPVAFFSSRCYYPNLISKYLPVSLRSYLSFFRLFPHACSPMCRPDILDMTCITFPNFQLARQIEQCHSYRFLGQHTLTLMTSVSHQCQGVSIK